MKLNPLIMDIMRGAWAIQPDALQYYGPLAYNIIYGKTNTLETPEPKSSLHILDSSGNRIAEDKDGNVNIPENSIAVVKMVGLMVKYGDWCTYGALDYVQMLEYADKHPNIIGTVLVVDGPGGSVSGIGPFVEFAKRKQKPIVSLYDSACSAHLWAMVAVSDYIMADNNISSAIGSIGVVLHWVDNRKYLENLGYEFHEVYPEESEDKNKAVRLAMEGKYDLIKKEMLSPMAIQFQNYIKEKLPNLKTDTPGVLTGKTFGADEAIKIGFTQSIGSMEDAQNMVRILAEMNEFKNNH